MDGTGTSGVERRFVCLPTVRVPVCDGARPDTCPKIPAKEGNTPEHGSRRSKAPTVTGWSGVVSVPHPPGLDIRFECQGFV